MIGLDNIILDNRIRIQEKLGEGGMGVVYSAFDQLQNKSVAIKILKSQKTSKYIEDMIRFKKEIEILSSLSHTNIIKLFGIGEYEGAPYMVMEKLVGDNLSSLILNNYSFYQSEAIELIIQITIALSYVHSHGILHRDIKPGNVFITREGNKNIVKLLDFGTSHIMELNSIKNENEIIGTFGYISPEGCGILDNIVDERSDLYSVGVIFYQLITGQMPFKSKSVRMLLHHQAALSPVRPIFLNSSIPEVLDEIIMKLINKDPDMRYQSAKGLLFDLKRLESGEKNFLIGVKDQKIKLNYQTKLIGREDELDILKKMFEQSSIVSGNCVLIMGEAGVGKTKLIDAFREHVYKCGAFMIRGRCINQSNKIPYQLFKDVVDEFIALWETWDNETSLEVQERLKTKLGSMLLMIVKLNPRMKKITDSEEKLTPLEPERENQRFYSAVSDFLCSIGKSSEPLVLLLEDLHWADEGSLLILDVMLNKIKASNIFIVGTCRSNEIHIGHGINNIKEKYLKETDIFKEVHLSSLSLPLVNKLISTVLCESEDASLQLSEFVHNKSGGNPLFAVQMLRDMVESKTIVWSDSQWQKDWNKLKGFYISDNIIDIVLKRSEKLTNKQLCLISTASAIGREFDIELLYSLLDFNKEEIIHLLDEIMKLNLMEKSHDKGKIAFAHDRIRDAFYKKISTFEKVKLHCTIAKILESDTHRSEDTIFLLAHHYIEGQDSDKALQYLLPAADVARESFAYDTSSRFYTIALELLDDKNLLGCDEWCYALESLSEINIIVGNCTDAIHGLNQLLELTTDNVARARILKKLGNAYYKLGDWDKAEELICHGLKILGETIPSTSIILIARLTKEFILHLLLLRASKISLVNKEQLNPLKNKDVYSEILSLYKSLFQVFIFKNINLRYIYLYLRNINISVTNHLGTAELGEAISAYSIMLSFIPLPKRSDRFFHIASKIFSEKHDDWKYFWNMRNQGFLYSFQGNRKDSIEYLQKARTYFENIGDYWELTIAYDGLTENYYYCGEYNKSLEIAAQNLQIKQQINETYGICNAKTELALSYIDMGEYLKAEKLLSDSLKLSAENKIWFLYCISLIYLGYLESEKNEYDKAVQHLNEAMKINEKNTFLKDYTILLYPRLAEALMKKANVAFSNSQKKEIKSIISKSLKLSRLWPNQYGLSLRVAASFEGLLENWNNAQRLFKKSLKVLRKTGRKFEEAKALMDYAFILEKRGSVIETRECLKTAYNLFQNIGVNHYAKKCAELLGYNSFVGNTDKNAGKRDRLTLDVRMDTVLTTSWYLSSILDTSSLLEKIMDCTIELVGAQRGLLFLYSQGVKRELEVKVIRNFSEYDLKNRSFEISSSILERIENEKAPVIISDAISDESFKNQASIIASRIRSVLCSPIISRGEMIGLIYLDNNLVSGLFTEDNIKVLNIISNQAGVSIENARLYNKLKAYSEEIELSRNEISQWNKELETRVIERTQQLQSLNDDLAQMNQQLKSYAETIEELSISRERNRMAKDVHDTVGHSMTLLLTLLEVCKISCDKDVTKTIEKLDEAAEIARTSLTKIRRSISGLLPEELEESDLVSAIERMVSSLKYTGVVFNFSVDQPDMKIMPKYATILFRACQESVTNALRHGSPTEIDIVLKLANNRIKLFIFDNGKGCKYIGEGIGLKSMRQRVDSVSGILRFGSDGKQGFHISIEIPIESD